MGKLGKAFTIILLWSGISYAYVMPIGIPAPPTVAGVKWGVETTRDMYLDCDTYKYDYGAGDVCYRTDTDGHPYTHYIDPDNVASTDTDNAFGTQTTPRKTRPGSTTLPDGSVVYYHSGTFTTGWSAIKRVGGTDPIFITGNSTSNPIFSGASAVFDFEADYVLVENFKFDKADGTGTFLRVGKNTEGARTHIAIRNCEFYNGAPDPYESSQFIRLIHCYNTTDVVQNIVIYNNYFHDSGEERSDANYHDYIAISADINVQNLWILNNTFYRIGGDGVQIASDCADDVGTWITPNHVYIGRNTAIDVYENLLDLKVCEDVIVSENVAHDIGPGYTTMLPAAGGAAFRYGHQDAATFGVQRNNVWTLSNVVYRNYGPNGAFYLNDNAPGDSDEMYYIGNMVYDCHGSANDATAFSSTSQENVYWLNNIAWNVDRGAELYGNWTFLLTLDVAPGGAGWAKGDTITGVTSGKTCIVRKVLTTTTYLISSITGAFTLGEVLTNGTDTADQGESFPTRTDAGMPNESLVAVNNVFGEINTGPTTLYWMYFGGTAASLSRAVITNNIYYDSNGTGKFRIGLYNPGVAWTDYTYAELGASGYSGFLTGSFNADPKFLAFPQCCNLQSGAPGAGTGASIATYLAAFNTRYGFALPASLGDINVDIGAGRWFCGGGSMSFSGNIQ